MTLFSDNTSHYSHRVRLVLAEKGVTVELVESETGAVPAELGDLNPYNTMPTLVDRELVLYESKVMMEYLDERFPHPPLLPVYPVRRAEYRLMMFRVEKDWYDLVHDIEKSPDSQVAKTSRKLLLESLCSLVPMLEQMPYFSSDDFTLIDCCMAPLLWRLPILDIELPKSATALIDYTERLFERPSFQKSLTETEREIRFPLAVAS